jgi:hypothetical protein
VPLEALHDQIAELPRQWRQLIRDELDLAVSRHPFDKPKRQFARGPEVLRGDRRQRELTRDAAPAQRVVAETGHPDLPEAQPQETRAWLRRDAPVCGDRPEELLGLLGVGDDPLWIRASGEHVDLDAQHGGILQSAAGSFGPCPGDRPSFG